MGGCCTDIGDSVFYMHVLTSTTTASTLLLLVMSTKQRFLVHYKSLVPDQPNEMTFGVFAKKHNQALILTKTFIYSRELHNHRDIDYLLVALPSNEAAMHEIPDIDDEGTTVVDDDKYNME